jgi:alpha-amylase/alpha-mannosidase (GH57 family)
MLLYAPLVWFVLFSVDAAERSDYVKAITPPTNTRWGDWGFEDWCSAGSYAYGFTQKVESYQGRGDDTSVNGIMLLCRLAL